VVHPRGVSVAELTGERFSTGLVADQWGGYAINREIHMGRADRAGGLRSRLRRGGNANADWSPIEVMVIELKHER
jgi:hypothetical protein